MSEDKFKAIFSKNLRYYMNLKCKTQIDIINDLDINKSSISSWVNGTRLPRMDKVEVLARYLGVSRSDLIEERPAAEKDIDELVLTEHEKEVIESYREASLTEQMVIRRILGLSEDIPKSEVG
jgi:transcriptional regulator with XRE-family HTH domain